MDRFLAYAQAHQAELIGMLMRLVECESPSDDPAAVSRWVDLFTWEVVGAATFRTFPSLNYGPHLQGTFVLPGRAAEGRRLLALGHSDTVWPMGTLASMPFREEDGRLWGPGVLDMKAGLVFFVFAMRALRDLDVPVAHEVILQINSDEEVGSDTSRALTEETAQTCEAVLVLEPGTGLEGKLKTSRKGVGAYTVTAHGRAAHAGVDFGSGASAILELARQIGAIEGFTDLERGLTVNPGVVRGGTRSNVIAAEASAEVDIRIAKASDAGPLNERFHGLTPVDARCRLEVTGGLNRPPLERTEAIAALFEKARRLALDLGVTLEESATGGGSDGNFTAALGIPTLDGLGAVGEGAHAAHESILVDRIADRVALLAKLVAGF